jgi:DNA polymerase elongation subunit (family B)
MSDSDENEEKIPKLRKINVLGHAFDFKMIDDPDTGRSSMHIWVMGKGDDRYLLRHESCPTFCYITFPRFVEKKPYGWSSAAAYDVFVALRNRLNYNSDDGPINHQYCKMKEIYNYQGDKNTSMMLVYFKTYNAMRHCKNLLRKPFKVKNYGLLDLEVLESEISMVRKIFSLKKCKYSQWFNVEGMEIPVGHPDRTIIAGKENNIKEVLIDSMKIEPVPLEKTKGWVSNPVILAFDAETYSPNHKRMPNELCADNLAYMIQAVSQVRGQRHTRKRFCILIGDCNEIKVGEATTVIFKGKSFVLDPHVVIIRIKNELELVNAYADIVNEVDPDIVTGYNIMSYDYKYLDTRLSMFYMESWPQMGRVIGQNSTMTKREWKSGAYGHNVVCNLAMSGRINIDMLPVVKRDYKLDKYTLDFVCKKFLGRGKHEVTAAQMFETFEFMKEAKSLKDKMNKLVENEGFPLIGEPDAEEDLDLFVELNGEKVTYKVVKMIWKIAKDRMTTVSMYGVEDSELVIDLFEKLNIWIGMTELNSIVGVSITDLFTRGQQVRCRSMLYDTAMEEGYVLNSRKNAKIMFFNGGFVGEPLVGLHNLVICVDFNSLYPSIIMANNICYTTFIPPGTGDEIPDWKCNIIEFDQDEDLDFHKKRNEDDAEDDGFDFSDFEVGNGNGEDDEDVDLEKKTIKRHYRFRFIKKEYREGIVPRMMRSLIGERKIVKKQVKVLKKELAKIQDVNIAGSALPQEDNINNHEDVRDRCDVVFNKYRDEDVEEEKTEPVVRIYVEKIEEIIEGIKTQLIVLDKRQLALKVSANSMFGFFGAQHGGMMPYIEIAMAITAWGREYIIGVNNFAVEKWGGIVVYGDTDSSMVDLHIKDPKDAVRIGEQFADEINGWPEEVDENGVVTKEAREGLFPDDIVIELEKVMRILCIKKKKYAYLCVGKDGEFERDRITGELIVQKKGIVLARRDNCKALRTNYLALLLDVLLMKPMDAAYGRIVDCVTTLLSGKVRPRGNLTVIRGLGADYKNDNYFMKVFATELIRVGKPANPGERLEYVVVKTQAELDGEDVKLGLKMRDIDMWEDSWRYYNGVTELVEEKEKKDQLDILPEVFANILGVKIDTNTEPTYKCEEIDYLYYIEHALMNPLDQLFSIGYKKELTGYDGIGYTPQFSRCHFCPALTPMKMIGKMMTDLIKGEIPNEDVIEMIKGLKPWFIKARKDVDDMIVESNSPKSTPVKKIRKAPVRVSVAKKPKPGVRKTPKIKIKIKISPKKRSPTVKVRIKPKISSGRLE